MEIQLEEEMGGFSIIPVKVEIIPVKVELKSKEVCL